MTSTGADEPGNVKEDQWLAEMVHRFSEGESLDLDALALECPAGVERLRALMTTMAIVAQLKRPSSNSTDDTIADNSTVFVPQPGVTLGDFRTVRVIGRGGMGVVYEAVQESLNRRVALKILPTLSAGDPRKLKRFQVEAQAAACLHHPHIVPVYLVGAVGDAHYFAMQFIQGQTLADVLAGFRRQSDVKPADPGSARINQGLSPRFAALLARQAAYALHYAHEQGILHRDVKPSNLLLEDSGHLWVADFGLARMSGGGDLTTTTGAMLGTLRYMSPEQVIGPRVVVDHRTDIYSLGATLYELITLRPAIDGDDRFELLTKISVEEPLRPRLIDPAIPVDLETIVLKALAKLPAERYASARDMADDLGRFLENRAILARPPDAIDRVTKWMRRHKPAMATASFALLLVAIGLAGAAFWRERVLRSHNRELTAALTRAEEHELAMRRPSYDSQIRLAQQTCAAGNFDAADQILEGLRPETPGRDLRGFEWYHLRRLCHLEFSVLATHRSVTNAIALSPDGRTLVTGHADGTLVFCDLGLRREFAQVATGDGRHISHLWFSPDGLVLASISGKAREPEKITLWNPTKARPFEHDLQIDGNVTHWVFSSDGKLLLLQVHDLNGDLSKNKLVFWDLSQGPEHPVPGRAPIACTRMAYSPGGGWLATSPISGTVTLRDATTGKPIKTLPKSFFSIGELAASVDGRVLAVADATDISVWDVATARELGTVAVDSPGPLTFSSCGNRLASLTDVLSTRTVELIADVRTKARRVPLEGGASDAKVVFSPDGRMIAARGTDGAATLWDTTSGRMLAKFGRDTGHVGAVAFTPDGESLIVPGAEGPIRVWHLANRPAPVPLFAGHTGEVWGLAYTPDGSTLISAADDAAIKLWDARDGHIVATLKGHGSLVTSVAVNRAGTLFASAGFDKTVRLWDLPSGRPRAVLRGHTDYVRTVAFSPDGRLVASGGNDHTVRVWVATSGNPNLVVRGHTEAVRALAFDPTGTLLVSTGDDRTIRCTDINTASQTFSLTRPYQNSSLAFSPDGSVLASGDDRGNLTLWDTATWTKPVSVKASDTPIWALSFSPDGRTIAAACGDGKIRLWDPITGQLMLELEGHAKRVNAVAFSPDGQAMVSGSHDGAIRLWLAERP